MSKRVLLFVVVIAAITCLTFSSTAESKEFTFRNGIKFGDTSDAILEKEGSQCKQYDKTSFIVDNCQLSGIRKSTLVYSLSYDRLSSIYMFYNQKGTFDEDNLESRKAEYDLINDGLIRKYGSNYKSDLNSIVSLPGGRINYYQTENGYEFVFTHQWILNYSTNDLIIEHLLVSNKDDKERVHYVHCISYQWTKPNMVITDIVDNDL